MEKNDCERQVYTVLKKLGIPYVRHEHPPVLTVQEAEEQWTEITGAHCKNLFLRNKKGNRHYLLILEASKTADLKALTKRIGEDRLSFASEKRLMKHMGLETGAVSPFGLINDTENHIQVIVDEELNQFEEVNFHPNVNTATIGISFPDFEKYLGWSGNSFRYLSFK
jgi:Ala-tRNA(Pro) deacylase